MKDVSLHTETLNEFKLLIHFEKDHLCQEVQFDCVFDMFSIVTCVSFLTFNLFNQVEQNGAAGTISKTVTVRSASIKIRVVT